MKVAILGGSFNPIHNGHLYLADLVLSELKYDRVLLVPAFVSPFKQGADTASADDRLAMVCAAALADPRLGVDDVELRRGGVSFTIDTVKDVIARYRPEGKLGLIIGDDLCADFGKWKDAALLAELCEIIVANRMNKSLTKAQRAQREEEALTEARRHGGAFKFPHTTIENEVMDISSSEIRKKIGEGGTWRSLVPSGARLFIESKNLYSFSCLSSCSCVSWEISSSIENYARTVLKPHRFLHSRNTALLASDLALRYGLDAGAAYLAGIGHDIGKALSDAELLEIAARDGKPFTQLEKKKPALLHGRAAAVLLQERFNVNNKDVLEAVAVHTFGAAEMCGLAKALFAADKIEWAREDVPGALRDAAAGRADIGLDELFCAVLEENMKYLKNEGLEIAEETLKLAELKAGKK
jgi:nicotinate-nucleotide adenylyltransferase